MIGDFGDTMNRLSSSRWPFDSLFVDYEPYLPMLRATIGLLVLVLVLMTIWTRENS